MSPQCGWEVPSQSLRELRLLRRTPTKQHIAGEMKAVLAPRAILFFVPHLRLLIEPQRRIPFPQLPGLLYYAQGRFVASPRMARLSASQAMS